MSKSLIGVAIESTEYMHVCKYIFFSIAARSVSGCSDDDDDDCPQLSCPLQGGVSKQCKAKYKSK